MIENQELRIIFGAKRGDVTVEWIKVHNAELQALYSLADIIRNLKLKRCGAGGSMRACHAAGRVRSPVGTISWVRFFFMNFSSPVRLMSGSFSPTRSPNII